MVNDHYTHQPCRWKRKRSTTMTKEERRIMMILRRGTKTSRYAWIVLLLEFRPRTDSAQDMTEEQRMEEGRRLFQILTACRFEQRVLTPHNEEAAKKRQAKLLEKA